MSAFVLCGFAFRHRINLLKVLRAFTAHLLLSTLRSSALGGLTPLGVDFVEVVLIAVTQVLDVDHTSQGCGKRLYMFSP